MTRSIVQAVGLGVGQVLGHVALRVDHHCPPRGRVADQVRGVRQAPEVVLGEEHGSTVYRDRADCHRAQPVGATWARRSMVGGPAMPSAGRPLGLLELADRGLGPSSEVAVDAELVPEREQLALHGLHTRALVPELQCAVGRLVDVGDRRAAGRRRWSRWEAWSPGPGMGGRVLGPPVGAVRGGVVGAAVGGAAVVGGVVTPELGGKVGSVVVVWPSSSPKPHPARAAIMRARATSRGAVARGMGSR